MAQFISIEDEVNGGDRSETSSPPPPGVRGGVHLIVCSHGMWGRPKDVEYLARSLGERLKGEKVVFISQVRREQDDAILL